MAVVRASISEVESGGRIVDVGIIDMLARRRCLLVRRPQVESPCSPLYSEPFHARDQNECLTPHTYMHHNILSKIGPVLDGDVKIGSVALSLQGVPARIS